MRLEYWLVPVSIAVIGAILRALWRHFRGDKNTVRFRVEFEDLEESEDPKWVEQFYKIKEQTDKIVWGVDIAIRSRSLEQEEAALDKAVNELPALIQELGAMPRMKSKRGQRSFNLYASGLASYLLACRYFKIAFEQDDEEAANEGAKQIKIACDLMDKSFFSSKNSK